MKRKSWALGTALALCSTLALTACGGDDDPDDGGGPAAGKELRVAMGAEPTTLNMLVESDAQAETLGYNVYETLTFISNDGEVEPKLAESWTTEGTTFTVKLREGVKFHDGSDLDAEDVAASFTKALETEVPYVVGMVSAKAVDETTVAIETEKENPEMPLLVSRLAIVPSELAQSEDLDSEMTGTGPYKLEEWERGDHITIVKNDDYWGDEAEFSKVTWYFRPDSATRVAMLKAGEADVAYNISQSDAQSVDNVSSGPASYVLEMRLKFTDDSPLKDIRLRQAMLYAMDTKSILDGVFQGDAEDTKGQIVIPQVFGFNPDMSTVEFDLDKAKALVQEAAPDGVTLNITSVDGRWDKSSEVTQAVEAMLTEAGFTVKMTYLDDASWIEALRLTAGGDFTKAKELPDAIFLSTGNVTFTAIGNMSAYTCTGSITSGCDEEYSAQVDKATSQTDLDAREAEWQATAQLMQDKALVVPLVSLFSFNGLADGIEWEQRPGAPLFLSNVTME